MVASDRLGGLEGRRRYAVESAIREAELVLRAEISLYFGPLAADHVDRPRAYAEHLHSLMAAPDRSILLLIDPGAGVVELVTGAHARRRVSDELAAEATALMAESFADGDLVGGVRRGLAHIAQPQPARRA